MWYIMTDNVAEREEGRLKNDLIRLNLEKGELKDRKNTYEVRAQETVWLVASNSSS